MRSERNTSSKRAKTPERAMTPKRIEYNDRIKNFEWVRLTEGDKQHERIEYDDRIEQFEWVELMDRNIKARTSQDWQIAIGNLSYWEIPKRIFHPGWIDCIGYAEWVIDAE